jgi:hypothetical protein
VRPSACAGFHIERHLKFRGLLDRQISGLRSLENFVNTPAMRAAMAARQYATVFPIVVRALQAAKLPLRRRAGI